MFTDCVLWEWMLRFSLFSTNLKRLNGLSPHNPAATIYGNYNGHRTFRRTNALSNPPDPRAAQIPTNLRFSLRDGFRRR